ncbi:amidohydrolase family protein [Mesorhizobium sp. PAMC28654]|uniref:amidohydrolase family protein n=1 Tax=Mesorhizobium sp. PAMC28654 TaxID=2880934 RepID=UPI001D09C524|nr:amidohydrolase family protein [Mesorhizobium sp. PAMC28654]UDL92590.1 amidohydrolase family protein [Mesorhizobium sp. PAMC28654]
MAAPIVDAHHHFWRVDRGDYHWMSPGMGLPLYRDYLPQDMAPLLRKAGVDKTVVVQAAQTEDETAFLLALASEADFVAGVVGWLDMEAPAFAAKLDTLIANPKFVGLRPMLQDLADDGYILRPAVISSLRVIAERGVAFDVLTYPRHLRNVAKALEAVPGLRAVIDHISKPSIASGAFNGWASDLQRIAAFPNVFCKLSGMITEADHGNWRPQDLKPYVDQALLSFGADRLMFGSDWPVCLLAGSYAEALNALRTVLDPQLSKDQQAAVYGLNAVRFYQLSI